MVQMIKERGRGRRQRAGWNVGELETQSSYEAVTWLSNPSTMLTIYPKPFRMLTRIPTFDPLSRVWRISRTPNDTLTLGEPGSPRL